MISPLGHLYGPWQLGGELTLEQVSLNISPGPPISFTFSLYKTPALHYTDNEGFFMIKKLNYYLVSFNVALAIVLTVILAFKAIYPRIF